MRRAARWFAGNWMAAGAVAGMFLLGVTPLIDERATVAIVSLALYQFHQVEEHEADRFRRFVNDLAGGREVLTTRAVLLINVPGVWGVLLVAAWLARAEPGAALIAPYLLGVNALVHLGAALVLRRYNPGLWTALVLFLPAAAWGLASLGAVSPAAHSFALGVALAIHAAIVLHVRMAAR